MAASHDPASPASTLFPNISKNKARLRHIMQHYHCYMGLASKNFKYFLGGGGAESGAGARAPRPVGAPAAFFEREASWSAERQFRFGPARKVLAQCNEFGFTAASLLRPVFALCPLVPLGYVKHTEL